MRKLWIGIPCSLLLSACATDGTSDRAAELDPNKPAHLIHHSEDTKGIGYFPAKRHATGKKTFIFAPSATAWAVYDASGHRIKTGRASGGKGWCDDIGRSCRTPSGHYAIYSKKGAGCESSKYPIETGGGADMPYCMHFNGGYAVHGSYHVPNYNASHGCIRVLPSAAKWLSQNLPMGSTVIVKPYGG